MADRKETKVWTPNENQARFLEILKDYPDGATLKDIEIDKGIKVASGTINNAHMRELVESTDGELVYEQFYRGVKVGERKIPAKIYKLKQQVRPRRKGLPPLPPIKMGSDGTSTFSPPEPILMGETPDGALSAPKSQTD